MRIASRPSSLTSGRTRCGRQYGIRVIPTQIFYDAEGKERFRHEGFYGREDMLAKWKELGVDLSPKASSPAEN
jgi:thioredoxin 1